MMILLLRFSFPCCRLVGNLICDEGVTESYCKIPKPSPPTYTTPLENCNPQPCTEDRVFNPSCTCAYPYTGTLFFRAPSFSNYGNSSIFASLQQNMKAPFKSHGLPIDVVSLSNPTKNMDNYLLLSLQVFPSGQDYFNRTGISAIGFMLSNQTFKPPKEYGPFYFIGNSYPYFAGKISKMQIFQEIICFC